MANLFHTLKSGKVVCYKTKSVESMRKIMKKMRDDDADRGIISFYHFECPKCKNNKAVWWLLQTRSGDEPPTQFYRCTKCAQTWREYS